ncbi:MAG: glycosyltransferase family 4 protein [candidate division WOR-3 bacterium]|nr:glycosyltransferase family 4 protein [candidate division WOR-3 bacterium]
MRTLSGIGVYLHDCYRRSGDIIWSNSGTLNFIKTLNLADKLNLAVAIKPESEVDKSPAVILKDKDSDIHLFPLPAWKNTSQTIKALPGNIKLFAERALQLSKESELIWIRTPSVVAPFFYYYARKSKKPIILHIAGNILRAARKQKYSGISLLATKLIAWGMHIVSKWMTRGSLTFVTGEELKKLFSSPLHPVHFLDDILLDKKDLLPPKKSRGQATKLLFVGQFAPGKGIEVLLDALMDLTKQFRDLNLFLAGTGPLLEPMRERIRQMGIENHAKLLGFVSPKGRLQKLYRNCDIFIQPSDSYAEGFPRVILEAWAAGLPVVATRLGGVPYRVRHGENGLLATPGSKDELRELIKNLISDADLRYRLSLSGYQTVKFLTFETQEKKIKSLIKEYFPNLNLA